MTDQSTNAAHGKAIRMAFADDGSVGGAAVFDGKGAYIDLGVKHDLPVRENYSISGWVLNDGKGDRDAGYGQKVFDKTSMYRDFYLAINLSDGRLRFQTYEGSAGSIVSPPGKDDRDNKWPHCGIIKQGAKGRMYVDVKMVSQTDNLKSVKTTGPLLLGFSHGRDLLQRRHCRGRIDEFQVFDRPLSPAQIKTLYQRVSPEVLAGDGPPVDPDQSR